jgi:orotate phosphoribosyltransferase
MSDETTESIIKRITVKYPEHILLPSGHRSDIFFDCIKLTPTELARLAALAVGDMKIDSFDMAVGIAYTGILFAGAVAGGRSVGILTKEGAFIGPDLKGKKVLVVDDVIVKGQQVSEAAQKITDLGAQVVGFACIVKKDPSSALTEPVYSAHQV